jgi:hypothetical protein
MPEPRLDNKKFWKFDKQYDPLSDQIDRVWAGSAPDNDKTFNNYYDYYFSGEDVKVYIDGLFGPEDELDIASFAYSVRQEKQPVYGFWSYNYDTVMLGTRIISGEITIFTRYPRRMTEMLEKAAKSRVMNKDVRTPKDSIISRLDSQLSSEDEKNIEKYWSYSQLDRITSDPAKADSAADTKSIFSAHPPFNFVILYGLEETALSPFSANTSEDSSTSSYLNNQMSFDVNQRSIRVDNRVSPMKIILQQVNLMNMSTNYSPGGQPVAESYQFIARDYYFTEADLGFMKGMSANNTSDSDAPSNANPDSRTFDQVLRDPNTSWSF